MTIDVATRSAISFGANPTFSLVGQYLQDGLGDHGPAIVGIEAVACFRGGRVYLPSLHEPYHATFLPSLPNVRFLRKKAQVELTYETAVADATFLDRYGFLSADVFGQALRELAGQLHLIDAKLKRSDAFDLAGFHRSVAALVSAAPTDDEGLRETKERLDMDRATRLFAMDPWDKLGIDWDDYHPAARRLLDDPFYWDVADDFAPNGNDTGADLLADFRRWNKRHPHRPPHEMARYLLRQQWEIDPIDLDAVDEATVRDLRRTDAIALSVTDEALIAVAFAAVKFRGCCDGETRRLALNAIARERIVAVDAGTDWTHAPERVRTLDLLASVLARMPESTS